MRKAREWERRRKRERERDEKGRGVWRLPAMSTSLSPKTVAIFFPLQKSGFLPGWARIKATPGDSWPHSESYLDSYFYSLKNESGEKRQRELLFFLHLGDVFCLSLRMKHFLVFLESNLENRSVNLLHYFSAWESLIPSFSALFQTDIRIRNLTNSGRKSCRCSSF